MAKTLTELARVVVMERGRVLAVAHHGDPERLGLPGGHLHPGEEPAHAAARELYEETGLQPVGLVPLGLVGEPGRLTYIFLAAARGRLRSSPEGRACWVRPEALYAGRYGRFHVAALRPVRYNVKP